MIVLIMMRGTLPVHGSSHGCVVTVVIVACDREDFGGNNNGDVREWFLVRMRAENTCGTNGVPRVT